MGFVWGNLSVTGPLVRFQVYFQRVVDSPQTQRDQPSLKLLVLKNGVPS